MQSKLVFCLALVLSGSFFGCANPKQSARADLNSSSISEKIEQRIPELKHIPTVRASGVWNGEEEVNAEFFLWKHPRYQRAGEFPRELATPLPYADIFVTVARYDSADDALRDLKISLGLRAATFRPPINYKGGTLYQYRDSSGGVQCALAQSSRYVIEIQCTSQGAEELTMKVMDTMLAEFN